MKRTDQLSLGVAVAAVGGILTAAGATEAITVTGPDGPLNRLWVERLSQEVIDRNAADGEPLSLAAVDLDGDGVPELICGFGQGGGGRITVHRGNVDALHPHSVEAIERRARGEFTAAPFVGVTAERDLSVIPDLVVTGDFDGDDRRDIAIAERGGGLLMLGGRGDGTLRAPERIDLPGGVTAVAAGEVNRRDGLVDLVVAVDGPSGPQLLVCEGPLGALRSDPEVFDLPAVATGLALGNLDEDFMRDVAVACGGEIVLIHGRDRRLTMDLERQAQVLSPRITRLSLPFSIRSLAAGDFAQDAWNRHELSLLSEAGDLHILDCTTDQPTPVRTGFVGPACESVICARPTARARDDMVLLDRDAGQVHIVGDTPEPLATLDLGAPAAAVLPMRLNADALSDLVILTAGGVTAGISSPVATITVNSVGVLNERDTILTFIEAVNLANGTLDIGDLMPEEAMAIVGTPGAGQLDEINFSIGSGVQTIGGNTATATSPLIINGATQPGFIGLPRIILEAELRIDGGSSMVRHINKQGFNLSLGLEGGNIVESNFIGTDPDGVTAAPGAVFSFISQSADNVIGGLAPAARNLFVDKFDITGTGAVRNRIENNHFGVDVSGANPIASSQHGIMIQSPDNCVGAPGAGNVISAHADEGILIIGTQASAELIQGNMIGTNAEGTTVDHMGTERAFGNTTGVSVRDGAGFVAIGGPTEALRNVISGNLNAVQIQGASDCFVQGNFIGTDVTGAVGLGNGGTGVSINGGPNLVGGGVPMPGGPPGNVISANFQGVSVLTDDCCIQGNLIGTDAAGTAALGNSLNGVQINGGLRNLIGGRPVGPLVFGNVISGNGADGFVTRGIHIVDFQAGGGPSRNVVQGNIIGLDIDGVGAVPNSGEGVLIEGNVDEALVGGQFASGEGNVISGNRRDGIVLRPIGQSVPDSNTIRGNIIGLTSDQSLDRPNGGDGVLVDGAVGTLVGGASILEGFGGNLIAENTRSGVRITGPELASEGDPAQFLNTIVANNEIRNNGEDGVTVFRRGANEIGPGNIIHRNFAGSGVAVVGEATTVRNTITRNSIFDNFGIDLGSDGITLNDAGTRDADGGPNERQNWPELSNATPTELSGTLTSHVGEGFRIEIFSSLPGLPSRWGRTFVASRMVSTEATGPSAGIVDFTFTGLNFSPMEPCITATATRTLTGDTSEFSNVLCFDVPPPPSGIDFGDAPGEIEPHYPTLFVDDGARHGIVADFQLGEEVDEEEDGQPSDLADGDDNDDGGDDEDGILLLTLLEANTTAQVQVSAELGPFDEAFLDAFIDFNRDFDWEDPGEKVLDSVSITEATTVFDIPVPASADPGFSYARFRYSAVGGLSFDGGAINGEVEDCRVLLVREGGLPDPAAVADVLVNPMGDLSAFDINGDGVTDSADLVAAINALNSLPGG